jgi:hypothetical protein
MKRPISILLGLCGAGLVLVFFSNTWDYGLNCTRCLYYEHHLQHRFFGVTLWETKSNHRDLYGRSYMDLFGRSCTHALKKGGFGHNPGCGITAEGMVFSGRNQAVKALLEAYQRNPNRPLAQESFALVENLFPEQTTVESYYDGKREGTNMITTSEMVLYGEWLNLVETTEEWECVNDAVRSNFAVLPSFIRDEKLMHTKTNASSSIVRQAADSIVKFPPKPE